MHDIVPMLEKFKVRRHTLRTITFQAIEFAEAVYAVEPSSAMRRYIRDKAIANHIERIFVVDGFLHQLPFK